MEDKLVARRIAGTPGTELATGVAVFVKAGSACWKWKPSAIIGWL